MRNPASFRDPSGFIFHENDEIFRAINYFYKNNYDYLISSGLYDELVSKNLLIPHTEVENNKFIDPNVYKIIQPQKVGFISYPYEWCFSQLKDAAILTLAIQEIALKYGMSLKDASAYNVQFVDGKPVLIDTLSFELFDEHKPWIAYNQFCKHFAAPLALMYYKNIELGKLLRVYLDGIPLDLASSLLSFKNKLHFGILIHIVLHAKAQAKFAGNKSSFSGNKSKLSMNSHKQLIESLNNLVGSLHLKEKTSTWNEYYADNHTDEYYTHKKELVATFLEIAKPESVWDIGANTGLFSRIAAEKNIKVVSSDFDARCVEINYQTMKKNGEKNILPLVMDLTNPSPGIGWANSERGAFLDRGPVDLVMALALVHHLAIGNNVPLSNIAELFSKICNWLIIEFVPKEDEKVQVLLSSREDIFKYYSEENFEKAFENYFFVEKKKNVGNTNRILYLMKGGVNFDKRN
jgi:hypothetical protein